MNNGLDGGSKVSAKTHYTRLTTSSGWCKCMTLSWSIRWQQQDKSTASNSTKSEFWCFLSVPQQPVSSRLLPFMAGVVPCSCKCYCLLECMEVVDVSLQPVKWLWSWCHQSLDSLTRWLSLVTMATKTTRTRTTPTIITIKEWQKQQPQPISSPLGQATDCQEGSDGAGWLGWTQDK